MSVTLSFASFQLDIKLNNGYMEPLSFASFQLKMILYRVVREEALSFASFQLANENKLIPVINS